MRVRLILAALVLTAGLGLIRVAASAGVANAASVAPARVPAGFVGVMASGPLFDPHLNMAHQLDVMVASGVESVRVSFSWATAQPYASFAQVPAQLRSGFQDLDGVPTRVSSLDKIVGLAAARGLTILPVVTDTPPWAAKYADDIGSPPNSPAQYAKFAGQLVRRYGPGGTYWHAHAKIKPLPIRRWQIWNEPNFVVHWSIQPFAQSYVALLRAARSAIKRIDPGAKIVLAGLANYSWRDLAQIYKVAGARGLFDIVAIHPYTAQPSGVIEILRNARAVMSGAGDRGKPMLATEIGWPSSQDYDSFDTNESGQASKVGAVLPLLAQNRHVLGLIGFDLYTWVGYERPGADTFDFAGLFRFRFNRLVAKPAFASFRRAALALEHCRQKAHVATRCARPG